MPIGLVSTSQGRNGSKVRLAYDSVSADMELKLEFGGLKERLITETKKLLDRQDNSVWINHPEPMTYNSRVFQQNQEFLLKVDPRTTLKLDGITGEVTHLFIGTSPCLIFSNQSFVIPLGLSGVCVEVFHGSLSPFSLSFPQTITAFRNVAQALNREFAGELLPAQGPLHYACDYRCDLTLLGSLFEVINAISDPLIVVRYSTREALFCNKPFHDLIGRSVIGWHLLDVLKALGFSNEDVVSCVSRLTVTQVKETWERGMATTKLGGSGRSYRWFDMSLSMGDSMSRDVFLFIIGKEVQ